MRLTGFLLSAVTAWFIFALFPKAFGQEPDDGKQAPQADASAQPEKRRHVPVFGNADEFAFVSDFGYYAPEPGFNRLNRDIDVQVARIALAAHLGQGWEFQFEGLALRAQGNRTLNSGTPSPPQVPSNALALGGGPLARWNFLQFSRSRVFVEAQGDLFLANRPFPTQGSVYDFLLRAGGGISFRVSDSYWIESAFHFAHISNGQCFCSGNPAWQGSGISIGIRRTFRHQLEAPGKPWLSIFRKADENAWETSAEYYTPLPGLDRKNGKVEGVMRALRISRAWHFPRGVEFQLGGTAQTLEEVVGFGPLVRWNFLESRRWRLFADGGADFLQTGSPAYIIPWPGTGYNFFLRAGAGASFRLHQSYWLEPSARWAHVTTGFGPGADTLLPWSGTGVSLSLRHTFH
jgi:hypothetical protein